MLMPAGIEKLDQQTIVLSKSEAKCLKDPLYKSTLNNSLSWMQLQPSKLFPGVWLPSRAMQDINCCMKEGVETTNILILKRAARLPRLIYYAAVSYCTVHDKEFPSLYSWEHLAACSAESPGPVMLWAAAVGVELSGFRRVLN